MMPDLFHATYTAMMACDPVEKITLVKNIREQWLQGCFVCRHDSEVLRIVDAGRPAKPELVSPQKVPRRRVLSEQGRAAMLHAIAHIEFNAINLALDAVYRFRELPRQYYADWLQVAAEEAYHFELLCYRMTDYNVSYGHFPAHNGLWEAALRTDHDALARMALVPRVMEARGLDATPGIMTRFKAAGDIESVAVLETILQEEIGHVEIGTRWFHFLCDQRKLPYQKTFEVLLCQYHEGKVRLPLHTQARLAAGFTQEELDFLEALAQ